SLPHSAAALPDPPPFPTRRSSDLDLACRTALTYHGVANVTIPVDVQEMKADKLRSKRNVPHHTSDVAARSARLPADEDLRRAARSEEHTSELQSRFDLVCRLLLEK